MIDVSHVKASTVVLENIADRQCRTCHYQGKHPEICVYRMLTVKAGIHGNEIFCDMHRDFVETEMAELTAEVGR